MSVVPTHSEPRFTDPEAQHQHPGDVRSGSMGLYTPSTDPFAGLNRDQIRQVQRDLNAHGQRLATDGIAGPLTRAAYQAIYGADPMPAHRTAAAMNSPAPPAPPAPAATGTAPAPAAPAAPPSNTPPPGSDDDIRARFGGWAWLLDVPEVGDKIREAAAAGWTTQQVEGAIQSTDWWKNTAGAGRAFQKLEREDPASAAAQIGQKRADLSQIAAQLGIPIAEDRLTKMATDVLRYGLDATQIQQMVGSEFHYTAGGQGGVIGQAEQQLRQMAANYFVPLSDDTLAAWEGQIAQGRAKPEQYQQTMVGWAKGTFQAKWIQEALDRGDTMTTISDPYRQAAARLLEVSPDQVDFNDPKFRIALTAQDKDGKPVGMDAATWERHLKTDSQYRWEYTRNAHAQGDTLLLTLARAMGVTA